MGNAARIIVEAAAGMAAGAPRARSLPQTQHDGGTLGLTFSAIKFSFRRFGLATHRAVAWHADPGPEEVNARESESMGASGGVGRLGSVTARCALQGMQ